MDDAPAPLLLLGVGNVLMGDEGVGVEVVRGLSEGPLPEGVVCLDGGTGSLQLLGPLLAAERVVLVDATADGRPPGTLTRSTPRFSDDYPPRMTAHDIGLKDLLDAFYLMGREPRVTLYTISIDFPQEIRVGLSPAIRDALPGIAGAIRRELAPTMVPG